MAESMSVRSYREVVIPSSSTLKWKEISFNTGASASSLQDIKVADSCGGYAYLDSGDIESPVSNRFIYWRTSEDVLELVEQSFDYSLVGSQVRIRFQGTQILGGISVKESHGGVVILVPTLASVHRLIFPHPANIQRDVGYSSHHSVMSIFYDVSLMTVSNPRNMHMLNPGGTITAHLHSATSYLTNEGEGLFAFSSNAGNILLIRMPPPDIQGVVQQFDLRQSSMMQKLFSGLMRGPQEATDAATDLVICPFHGDSYIFAVCRDFKLRIWSTKTRECIQVFNLVEFCPDLLNLPPTAGAGHTIKRVLNTDAGVLKLCIHFNVPDRTQFCIIQPQLVSGAMEIFHCATTPGTPDDLVDFTITEENLWTLSTSQTGECVAYVRSMLRSNDSNWQSILLHPAEASEVIVPPHSDPREVFMDRIFHPRRFSSQDIQKALNVFRRSLDSTVLSEGVLPVQTLKEEVTVAVEDAIRIAASANEMAEEEYYQIQLEQWTKFHSCCVQYQEVGAKMKGLFTDPVTELVCFIKKGDITYVRPCDRIEELFIGNGQWTLLSDQAHIDESLIFDTTTLGRCLDCLNGRISEETAAMFEYKLSAQENVLDTANIIVEDFIINIGSETDYVFGALLETIRDFPGAVKQVLSAADLSVLVQEDASMDTSGFGQMANQVICSHIFTSQLGVDILANTFEQICTTRFTALRDLLLLQVTVSQLTDKGTLSLDDIDEIDHDLIPRTVSMINAYFMLKYVSAVLTSPEEPTYLESNVRQLACLEITDSSGLSTQQKTNLQNVGLAELFIQGSGGIKSRQMLAQARVLDGSLCATWSIGVLGLTKFLSQQIWPMQTNVSFKEFLVGSSQYLHLQEFCRLLGPLSDWHQGTRKFMQALCYLHFDEPLKAAKCFIDAKMGIMEEPFLREKILQSEELDPRKLDIVYYLKVLRQFEEFGAPDIVVYLAQIAIGFADDDDANLPTLWSKVFKYQLELGHNQEAYTAMISNPDPSRKKDCLRQLLVTLCERNDLRSLITFKYIDLEEDVINILESRARSVDLATHNYYDLLYAFHINRNNFRRAGTIMYEYGSRLGREKGGRQGLEKQCKCYLAALNVLRLVNPDYAWIVKPVQQKSQNLHWRSKDKNQEQIYNLEGAKKMEIIELKDIEKELILVEARLKVLQKETDIDISAGPTPSPDEMVGLLVKVGMYDRAINICQVFDMKLFPVFESLALRCVNLARSSSWDDSVISVTWDWLMENSASLAQVKRDASATDTAWSLLQYYLQRYEDRTGHYHRCVAIKLLSHSFPLPTWLVNSYKGLNMPELLKIYIDFDLLEDSVLLTMEYVDAVMDSFNGKDSLLFNVKGSLQSSGHVQTSWMPYSSIDLLLIALRDHRHDITYGKLYDSLNSKMSNYYQKISSLSSMIAET